MAGNDPQVWADLDGPLPVIATVGLMAFDPVYAQRVHVDQAAEILHVVAGSVKVHMPGGPVTAGPGDTILVPSGSAHRDEFDLDQGLEVFFCSFRWAAEARFFRAVPPQALGRLSPGCKSQLAALADLLRADLTQARDIDQLVARSRVLTALMLIFRDLAPAADSPGEPPAAAYGEVRRHELMSRAREYLQQHYARPVSLDEIADALHVSGYYLSHVFSAESDFTLFSYLTTVRMERAKALLLAGSMNVSQVARAVGYQSPNYFSKVFRRHFDCSPRDFVVSHRSRK